MGLTLEKGQPESVRTARVNKSIMGLAGGISKIRKYNNIIYIIKITVRFAVFSPFSPFFSCFRGFPIPRGVSKTPTYSLSKRHFYLRAPLKFPENEISDRSGYLDLGYLTN